MSGIDAICERGSAEGRDAGEVAGAEHIVWDNYKSFVISACNTFKHAF